MVWYKSKTAAIVASVIAIPLLFLFTIVPLGNYCQPDKTANSKVTAKNSNASETSIEDKSLVFKLLQTIFEAQKSQPKYDSVREQKDFWQSFWCDMKLTDALIAAFTGMLFVATIALWLATRNLVEEAEDTAKKELRAYVALDDIYFHWNRSSTDPEDRSDIVRGEGRAPKTPRIRVSNFGKTPANNMTIRINGTKAGLKESWPKTYLSRDHKVPRQMLSPTQRFGVWVPVSAEFDPGESADPNGKVRFVYGSIIYEDIYKRWWVNHFCYFYDPDPNSKNRFIPHTEYNYEDKSEYPNEDAARDSLTYI